LIIVKGAHISASAIRITINRVGVSGIYTGRTPEEAEFIIGGIQESGVGIYITGAGPAVLDITVFHSGIGGATGANLTTGIIEDDAIPDIGKT
jgi:hypothetical protein